MAIALYAQMTYIYNDESKNCNPRVDLFADVGFCSPCRKKG